MPEQRNALPFEPKGSGKGSKPVSGSPRQEAIPRYVADRMARRVAVFAGLPSLAGMGVFVGSYFLVTRGIADIAPGLTLTGSGLFFLLGLVGLSVGVLTARPKRKNSPDTVSVRPGAISAMPRVTTK